MRTMRCPFCAGTFTPRADYSVIHTMPPCEHFLTLEPDRFLQAARRAIGIDDATAARILGDSGDPDGSPS